MRCFATEHMQILVGFSIPAEENNKIFVSHRKKIAKVEDRQGKVSYLFPLCYKSKINCSRSWRLTWWSLACFILGTLFPRQNSLVQQSWKWEVLVKSQNVTTFEDQDVTSNAPLSKWKIPVRDRKSIFLPNSLFCIV